MHKNEYLINEYPLLILPTLAKAIGLNKGIVLQQIHYWLEKNSTNENMIKEEKIWCYNSYPKWQKQFPFWDIQTIRRTILSLEEDEIIISSNFNRLKMDKTKWYTINYEQLTKVLKIYHDSIKMIRPIPDTNKDTNKDKNISKEIYTSSDEDVSFKENSSKKKVGKLSSNEKENIEQKVNRNKTTRKVLKRWNTFQEVTKHKTPNKTWLEVLKNINYLKSGKMSKFPFEDDFLKRNKIPKDFLSHKFTEKEIIRTIKKIPSFLQEGYFMKEKKFSKSLPNIIFNPYSKIQSIFLMAYFNEAKPIAKNIVVECKYPKVAEIIKRRFGMDFDMLTVKEKKEFNQNFVEIERRTEELGYKKYKQPMIYYRFYPFLREYCDILEEKYLQSILKSPGGKITPYHFSPKSWVYEKIILDVRPPMPDMKHYMLD